MPIRIGLATVAAALLVSATTAQDKAPPAKKTFTYKTAGDVPVRLDVYRADDTAARPVVVWIHGGALITGSRLSVPRQLLEQCRSDGFALVSIDYRLAPEVKLPDIVADLDDAFRWLRDDGPRLAHLDPGRVVVTGGSAGGYLTLLAGARLKSPVTTPRGLVAYWGYGDIDGDWYAKPSEHYRKQPLVSKEDAYRGVGGPVLTGSEPGFDGKARGRFYLYLRQTGQWPRVLTGFDPATDRAKFDPYCPVRNVTPAYPPTLLIHGTEDTDVPYGQSAAMAKELARHGVPHELVTVRGAGHGLSGGDPKLVAQAHERAAAFIRARLKARE